MSGETRPSPADLTMAKNGPPPSINGWNGRYVDELYTQWLEQPDATPPEWARFFEGFDLGVTTADDADASLRLFDDDETGKISFKNLKRVAKELGENMTDEELQEMIDEADRDGDGEVSEEEFFRIMKKTSLF